MTLRQIKRAKSESDAHLCNESLQLIEREARAAMRRHPKLSEYVQGMGTWFFKDQRGEPIDLLPKALDRFKRTMEGLNDLELGILGIPMRFTAGGPKKEDW